jgi:hypothetical protein
MSPGLYGANPWFVRRKAPAGGCRGLRNTRVRDPGALGYREEGAPARASRQMVTHGRVLVIALGSYLFPTSRGVGAGRVCGLPFKDTAPAALVS